MPIPDFCLRCMIFSVKMICSRFTAESLENKCIFSRLGMHACLRATDVSVFTMEYSNWLEACVTICY